MLRAACFLTGHWDVVNVRDGSTLRGEDEQIEKDKEGLHQ